MGLRSLASRVFEDFFTLKEELEYLLETACTNRINDCIYFMNRFFRSGIAI
jgi:hypothetical protein